MTYIIIRKEVKNYNHWKRVFDEDKEFRRSNGSMGGRIFLNADNSDEVIVLLSWSDESKARQFAQSTHLRESMKRAGVIGKPQVLFLDEAAVVTEGAGNIVREAEEVSV